MNNNTITQKDRKPKTSPKRRRFWLFAAISVVLIIAAVFTAEIYRSNFVITPANYTIDAPEIDHKVRIVQISDLHNKSFGENNKKLIAAVSEENPNMIVLTGDIVDRYHDIDSQEEFLNALLPQLVEIAPLYACIGNHEQASIGEERYIEILRGHGCVFLDNEYHDINLGGNEIRIGGLNYYRRWDEEKNAFMRDFCDTDRYTLLLCHFPEYHFWGLENYSIDLTLSGHTHGGLVRAPFVGGIYAPEQGMFPQYDKGYFEDENSTLIVSSGLASSPFFIPRFLNPAEYSVIDLS